MKTICIAAMLLLSAGWCVGQAPRASLNIPSTEVYLGYVATYPDYGPQLNSYRLDGFEGQFGKGITSHALGIASGVISFGTVAGVSVKEFSGTAGVKYNILTGKFRPYAMGQAGYAFQTSNGLYAGDHHPPLKSGATDHEDGLTYRMGGGADLQLTPKIYWRILQWDVQPQPWARHTPWYQNFSSGVGYRF
jgi:hypothetical protein